MSVVGIFQEVSIPLSLSAGAGTASCLCHRRLTGHRGDSGGDFAGLRQGRCS